MGQIAQGCGTLWSRMPAVVPFGSYQLLMPLAVGGMAELFVAKSVREAGFEKLCVIKKVLPHLTGNRELASMFLNEARLAAQLHHPGICQVFDLGREGTDYYLAMEYLAGEDLSAIMRQTQTIGRQVPFAVTAKIIALAAEALHYAHEFVSHDGARLELVHRDVSPSNLFVTYQGAVKLIDFGIAHAEALAPMEGEGKLRGKIAYMAPEVLRGERVTRAADIWGLGVCLFELVTGRRLVEDATLEAARRTVIDEEVPRPSEVNPAVPSDLEAIVLKALARAPERRYATAEALRADLERFIADRTYVPQGVQLGGYLRELFGDARAERKLRPALSVPDEGEPGAGTQRLEAPTGEQATVVSSAHVVREARRSRLPLVLSSLVLGAAVVGAAVFGFAGASDDFGGPRPLDPVRSDSTSSAPMATSPGGEGALKREAASPMARGAAAPREPAASAVAASGVDAPLARLEAAAATASSAGHASAASGAASPKVAPGSSVIAARATSGATTESALAADRARAARASVLDPSAKVDPDVPTSSAVKPVARRASSRRAGPRAGELHVTSNVPVEVWIDGSPRGQTPLRLDSVAAGRKTLRLQNHELGIRRTVRLRVPAGERATYDARFSKGRLNVVVQPWADVWLDGTPLGQTPLAGREVWEGRHTLRLVNPKGEKTLSIDIAGGKTTVVRETIP